MCGFLGKDFSFPDAGSEGLFSFILHWGLVESMLNDNALLQKAAPAETGGRRLGPVGPGTFRSAVVDSGRPGAV